MHASKHDPRRGQLSIDVLKGHPMTTTSLRMIALTLIGATALAACAERNDTTRDTATAASTRPDSASGMTAMPGMDSMMTGMMDSVQVHMRMMDTMSADQMKAMLPMHRQMVANMLSRMNQEMRSMNMQGDRAWTATADSLRQDLLRMPELSGQELKTMMPAHQARVTRLMKMHRDMMGRMKS
jgi:hypothetical protein